MRLIVIGGMALAVLAIASPLASAPADESDPRCKGRQPTIVGTAGDDVLRGTEGRDVIWGGPGNDRIYGLRGNDLICGGAGSDFIYGGRGNDELYGGAGDEDRVLGGLGDDIVSGGPGDRDEAGGGLGIDMVSGGRGDEDLVHGDYGWDRMDGGGGRNDIASFATDVGSPGGGGVWVNLRKGIARGDGRDRLHRFDIVEGSAFDDVLIGDRGANVLLGRGGDDRLIGGGGVDTLDGGPGSDRCAGAKGRTVSCGPERTAKATAYVEMTPTAGGGAGLTVVGGGGDDHITASFDAAANTLGISARGGIAIGPGCGRDGPRRVSCTVDGPARWLMVDLGSGDDSFRTAGSLEPIGFVRIAGGRGDDVIKGGPQDDLIEGGFGADKLYGGAGEDGLIGSLPGPTFLYGGPGGDLLAAGGGCAGGRIVGGPGRDNASFAETQGHPGRLIISLPAGKAWNKSVKGCRPVGLDRSIEDIEGSFDWDLLIGDGRANNILGQPGADWIIGGGGADVIDARDGGRDHYLQCGRGTWVRPPAPPRKGKGKAPRRPPPVLRGTPSGRVLMDANDPQPLLCEFEVVGVPVPGLNHDG